MAKASNIGSTWRVPWKWIPAITAITTLVIQTFCAICTDGSFSAAHCATACRRESWSALTTALDGDICTRRPNLRRLVRIPPETQDVITFRHIGHFHLIHNAEIELLKLVFFWCAS